MADDEQKENTDMRSLKYQDLAKPAQSILPGSKQRPLMQNVNAHDA